MNSEIAAYWKVVAREIEKQLHYPPPSTWKNSTILDFVNFVQAEVPRKCGNDLRKLHLCSITLNKNGVPDDYRIEKDTIRRLFLHGQYPKNANRRNSFAILLGARDETHFKMLHGLMNDVEYDITVKQRPEILQANFNRVTQNVLREAKMTTALVHPHLADLQMVSSLDLLTAITSNANQLVEAAALVNFNLANQALVEFRNATARKAFEDAFRLKPGFYEAKLGIAYTEMLHHNFEVALHHLSEIPPTYHELFDTALVFMSTIAVNLGDFEQASEYVERLMERRGRADAGAMNALGAIQLAEGRFSEAENTLTEGASLFSNKEPFSGTAFDLSYNLAQSFAGQGRGHDAIALLSGLLDRERTMPEGNEVRLLLSRSRLAQLQAEQNDPASRRKTLEDTFAQLMQFPVLVTHPAARSSLYELCNSYLDAEQYQDAVNCIRFSLPTFKDCHGPDHLATLTLESYLTYCEQQLAN